MDVREKAFVYASIQLRIEDEKRETSKLRAVRRIRPRRRRR